MSTIPNQEGLEGMPEFDFFGRTARLNPNGCGCHKCNPKAAWMVTCDICGNKRCPHATDHELDCTNSNLPGQKGSVWEDYKVGKPKRESAA